MKTDAQIQQDVSLELKWVPSIDATHIGVAVSDGVVTLEGRVSSYAEKWDAEQAAQRVSGVKALAVAVEVALPGPSMRNDADIARTAQNVLEWMTYLPRDRVKILVEGGWITLSGEVEWQYQKQAAADALRHLMGVKGISNNIALRLQETPRSVKADIEAALMRRANGDAQEISVEVLDGTVTLGGTAHSWATRTSAMHAAWCTPGVQSVIDHIAVVF